MELHRTQPDPGNSETFWGSSRAVRRLNDTICIENGYSIVENPKRHGKSYNKWLGDKKKPPTGSGYAQPLTMHWHKARQL